MPSKILDILGRLNKAADSRMEDRERKRMLVQDHIERNRQEVERGHELNMQQMMFTFIQQMTAPIWSLQLLLSSSSTTLPSFLHPNSVPLSQ